MIAITESFWQINLGHVLVLIAMLGGFIVWFSRFEGKIRTTAEALSRMGIDTTKTFSELIIRIERIDREGSRKSQQTLAAEEKLNAVTLSRLDKLDALVVDLLPKVASMAKDTEWIARYIKKNGNGFQ